MPRASELEEFGLEVESEHHSLIAEQSSSTSTTRRPPPMEIMKSPTKAQLALLQSTNSSRGLRINTVLRPGMLRWASLVIVLAVIVFLNIGQESEETTLLTEEESLEDLESKNVPRGVDEWAELGGKGNLVFGEGESPGENGAGDAHGSPVDLESHEDENDEDDDDHTQSHPNEETIDQENFDLNDKNQQAESEKNDADAMDESDADDIHVNQDGGDKPDPENGEKKTEDMSLNADSVGHAASESNIGSFTSERLAATRAAAQSLVRMIEEYYYGAETTSKMLIESWVGPWDFDVLDDDADHEKRDRLRKLVDTMARALVTDEQKEFVIGTIGSSVAAGHDNCNYDSYENQLQRTFGPVWEAAGMTLVCQNAGEGGGCGDNFSNQVFCIKQNVSPNVDIVHYTWSYFEVGNNMDALVARENLVRWTQMLPRQPPVHVLNVEGSTPASDEEKQLATHYALYGYDAFYMRYAYLQGGHDYDTEAKNGLDRFGWGVVGDGYHNTTRYGELEEDEGRKESLGVVLRNWHPGPLGFQLVSDAFALVYSKAILLALDIIEKDITAGNDPRVIWSASNRKIVSKRSLPEPLRCDPEYCVVDEVPGCTNYELPTYGVRGARVEDPNDDLNPHKGELQKWEIWYEPRDFWHLVSKEDVVYFQDRDDKEICKHLDNCGGISATSSENGMVVFRLPKMEVGLVAICGCCGDVEIATPMFLNNTNIEVRYNGELLDRSTWDLFPNHKCARLLKRFPTEGAAARTPTGHAYLSVKALDGLETPVRISHVITL